MGVTVYVHMVCVFMCVCVCVCWDRPEGLTKAQAKSHCRPNRVHAVSLCVIGGVIEFVWLSEMGEAWSYMWILGQLY